MAAEATPAAAVNVDDLFDHFDRECPGWGEATVLVKMPDGDIAGYGRLDRAAHTVAITADPSGARLLAASAGDPAPCPSPQ